MCYLLPENETSTVPSGNCGCLAPPARLELTTLRLGGVRSIQVSYGGIWDTWCILLNFLCGVKVQCRNFGIMSLKMIFPLYRFALFGYNAYKYVNFTK